jgi:hypothetical protein
MYIYQYIRIVMVNMNFGWSLSLSLSTYGYLIENAIIADNCNDEKAASPALVPQSL